MVKKAEREDRLESSVERRRGRKRGRKQREGGTLWREGRGDV